MRPYKNDAVVNQYKALKDAIEKAIQKSDQGQFEEAAGMAENAAEMLKETVHQIGKDYPQAFFTNKAPGLADVMEAGKARHPHHADKEVVTRRLVSLDKAASQLGCEIDRIYARRFRPGKILWAVPALAAFLFFIWIWDSFSKGKEGLTGYYYYRKTLNGPSQKIVDPEINFDWGERNPLKSMTKKDNFSIRWTGYLRVPKTGYYEISTVSDDGVRLIIGTTVVIEDWTRHRPKTDTVGLDLQEGYHPIRLEYFESTHGAVIRLLWRWADWAEPEIIKPKYLVPTAALRKTDIPVQNEAITFMEVKPQ